MKFSTFFVFSTALLALCLMLVFRCRRQKIRIQALEQRLQQEHRLAHTDPLTGLSNRAAYEERLDLLTDRHSGADICCVVLDADRFKSVNDENGHHAGDIALQNIACTLQKIFNEDDDHELFRIGGDEFALILHGLSQYASPPQEHRTGDRTVRIRRPRFSGGTGRPHGQRCLWTGGPENVSVQKISFEGIIILFCGDDKSGNPF